MPFFRSQSNIQLLLFWTNHKLFPTRATLSDDHDIVPDSFDYLAKYEITLHSYDEADFPGLEPEFEQDGLEPTWIPVPKASRTTRSFHKQPVEILLWNLENSESSSVGEIVYQELRERREMADAMTEVTKGLEPKGVCGSSGAYLSNPRVEKELADEKAAHEQRLRRRLLSHKGGAGSQGSGLASILKDEAEALTYRGAATAAVVDEASRPFFHAWDQGSKWVPQKRCVGVLQFFYQRRHTLYFDKKPFGVGTLEWVLTINEDMHSIYAAIAADVDKRLVLRDGVSAEQENYVGTVFGPKLASMHQIWQNGMANQVAQEVAGREY